MKHPLIVICGKKRSGKDFCAKILSDYYGFDTYQLASPIKRALWANQPNFILSLDDFDGNGFDREKPLGYTAKAAQNWLQDAIYSLGFYPTPDSFSGLESLTIRQAMQVLGKAVVDSQKDYFTCRVPTTKPIIVTDCRMQHEYDYFRARGAKFIHVSGLDYTFKDNDYSERGLQPMSGDLVVMNDYTPAFVRVVLNKLTEWA